MSTAEERDWVLREIRRAGMIDMRGYHPLMEQEEIARLFFKHRPTFALRLLIVEDVSPANNPNLDFHRVQLTNEALALLDNDGFVAEQERENKDLQDKITAQQALIDTARWQAKGVIITAVLGVITIIITGWTAYMTYVDDKEDRSKLKERLSTLEKKLLRPNNIVKATSQIQNPSLKPTQSKANIDTTNKKKQSSLTK